jgi:hypothetical protein
MREGLQKKSGKGKEFFSSSFSTFIKVPFFLDKKMR